MTYLRFPNVIKKNVLWAKAADETFRFHVSGRHEADLPLKQIPNPNIRFRGSSEAAARAASIESNKGPQSIISDPSLLGRSKLG